MLTAQRVKTHTAIALTAVLSAAALIGCQPNQTVQQSAPNPVPQVSLEPRKTDLETDIKDIETAGLEHIFIVKRRDGGVFDKDDKRFLREFVPDEISRRVASDDDRAFLLGTNFIIPEDMVTKWRERFTVIERNKTPKKESKTKQ